MADTIKTTLYLVRHGQSEGNLRMIVDGQCGGNFPLTDTGEKQAAAAGDRLREVKFDLAYASDLDRAHNTAKIILGKNETFGDVGKIEVCELIRERHLGEFEGKDCVEHDKFVARVLADGCEKTEAELLGTPGVFKKGWHITPEGGETLEQVGARAAEFLKKVAADARRFHAARGRGAVCLAGTHGGLLKELVKHLVDDLGVEVSAGEEHAGKDPRMIFSPNTGVTVLEMSAPIAEGGKVEITCATLHCSKHLK